MKMIQIGMDEALAIEQAGASSSYEQFKDKFKPKKTTDDCYTPEPIFEAVSDWVAEEYNLDKTRFVRPFWPGGDYRTSEYPASCVVVDNPPFSIMVEILRFYLSEKVKFFLFAPALTLFAGRGLDVTYIATGCPITYANGAQVPTSFVTNLDTCRIRTAPDLYTIVVGKMRQIKQEDKKELPKYIYPDHVVTAAILQRWSKYGIEFRVDAKDCVQIASLDEQRKSKKSIFGSGFLLSERAAAERAAAETWTLSEREQRIVESLGTGGGKFQDTGNTILKA